MMGKHFLLLTVFTSMLTTGNTQNIDFIDLNFKLSLLDNREPIDTNNDGEISYQEAKLATSIALFNNDIVDTDELIYFTNLEYLSIRNNALTSINLSKNTKLRSLDLEKNLLTEIDLSSLSKLERLSLSHNKIKKINLSNQTKLKSLTVKNTDISTFYLRNNTSLTYIY